MINLLRNDNYMKLFFVMSLIFGIGLTIYGTVLAATSIFGIIVTIIGVAMLLIGNIAHVNYTRKRFGK